MLHERCPVFPITFSIIFCSSQKRCGTFQTNGAGDLGAALYLQTIGAPENGFALLAKPHMVGRGYFNDNVGDFIKSNLDEVRVTKSGLPTGSLLANVAVAVVPETGTAVLSLLGVAGVGLGVLRRRTK